MELCFILSVEKDPTVKSIINEPVHIKLTDGSIYIPDYLINSNKLIELKPHNHLLWTKDSDNNRFEKEIIGAKDYCEKQGWEFEIVYDTDLNFETGRFKKYLLSNPDIIERYNIRFNKPLMK